MVAYYQRSISAWMDGTEGLDDGEYRAYDVICNLIYLNDGPIIIHESGIAGRCNQHPLRFRRNFAKLVERGKLVVGADGKISNARVESELKKIRARRVSKAANPAPTPAAPSPYPGGVDPGSAGGKANKPLKDNEPGLFADTLEKRREVSVPNGTASAVMRNPPLDLEADYYRRCRDVLGEREGGSLGTLILKAKGGNIAQARAAIETAATRGDTRQYVGAIVRGVRSGKTGNAFAALRSKLAAQQQEGETRS